VPDLIPQTILDQLESEWRSARHSQALGQDRVPAPARTALPSEADVSIETLTMTSPIPIRPSPAE
jgi:hypothetical protein